MFPTLSDLFEYFFHIHISFPVQTFGFFVALAFLAAFMAFTSEFKRKEALGLVHAFKRKVIIGKPSSITELSVNAALGFLFGFKIIGALINYTGFISDPKNYILSLQGNLYTGLLFGAGWAGWAYYDRKKAQLPEPKIVEETVHPYQLMIKITFWAGFLGFIGAKLFDTVEHIGYFLANPAADLLSSNGFTYYGGFLFGMLTFFYIGCKNGIKLAHIADTGAPGIMLAYGVGRIGCQLSGDGDWGIINTNSKPAWLHWLPDWMWSYTFPHNVLNQGMYMNGCQGKFCSQLVHGVYPTSFYEATLCILIFVFLWLIRKHITTPAFMAFLTLILMGVERYWIETIRVTIKYNVWGIMLTQAQMISIGTILVGTGGIIYLYAHKKFKPKKEHSPA